MKSAVGVLMSIVKRTIGVLIPESKYRLDANCGVIHSQSCDKFPVRKLQQETRRWRVDAQSKVHHWHFKPQIKFIGTLHHWHFTNSNWNGTKLGWAKDKTRLARDRLRLSDGQISFVRGAELAWARSRFRLSDEQTSIGRAAELA